jgi:hypothetical protein
MMPKTMRETKARYAGYGERMVGLRSFSYVLWSQGITGETRSWTARVLDKKTRTSAGVAVSATKGETSVATT